MKNFSTIKKNDKIYILDIGGDFRKFNPKMLHRLSKIKTCKVKNVIDYENNHLKCKQIVWKEEDNDFLDDIIVYDFKKDDINNSHCFSDNCIDENDLYMSINNFSSNTYGDDIKGRYISLDITTIFRIRNIIADRFIKQFENEKYEIEGNIISLKNLKNDLV